MKVELLYSSPLWVCAKAIRKCWASEDKSDTVYKVDWLTEIPLREYDGFIESDCIFTGEKDKELIERVGNKNKHKSTLEHLVYTFDIDGISRACLQELARHRMASYSVKSTRYTLKELKNTIKVTEMTRQEISNYIVYTDNNFVNQCSEQALGLLQEVLQAGVSNDVAKYCLPEAYKTSLVMTINARSLQNFLELRTSKSALWEIQELAKAIYEQLPAEHKYLFLSSMIKRKDK